MKKGHPSGCPFCCERCRLVAVAARRQRRGSGRRLLNHHGHRRRLGIRHGSRRIAAAAPFCRGGRRAACGQQTDREKKGKGGNTHGKLLVGHENLWNQPRSVAVAARFALRAVARCARQRGRRTQRTLNTARRAALNHHRRRIRHGSRRIAAAAVAAVFR